MRVFLWFSHHFFHLKRRENFFFFFFLNSEKSTAKNRKIVGHNTYTHRSNIWRRIEKKKKKKYGHSCWAFICVCTYIVRDEERTKGVALPAGRPIPTLSIYINTYYISTSKSRFLLLFLYSYILQHQKDLTTHFATTRALEGFLLSSFTAHWDGEDYGKTTERPFPMYKLLSPHEVKDDEHSQPSTQRKEEKIYIYIFKWAIHRPSGRKKSK